jgi:chemotaxis protein methyltransferase CheR
VNVAKAHAAASVDSGREFEYTDSDFERVRKLIYARVGISLAPVKQDMVYSRLARRLRSLSLGRFKDYLSFLESNPDDEEWQAFTNALTTNLTSFFRESHHFDILRDHLASRRSRQDISIWCSASSTGEEPYSIAITAAEVWGRAAAPVSITATDVDTSVLQKAKEGIYPLDRLERMSSERIRSAFQKGSNAQEGFARVRSELREMVSFGQQNLLDPRYWVQGPFDAIFCRNVLIYFDKATQAAILRKMVPLLKPDGLLFVGHSESLFHVADVLKLQGKTVYVHAQRKVA